MLRPLLAFTYAHSLSVPPPLCLSIHPSFKPSIFAFISMKCEMRYYRDIPGMILLLKFLFIYQFNLYYFSTYHILYARKNTSEPTLLSFGSYWYVLPSGWIIFSRQKNFNIIMLLIQIKVVALNFFFSQK